MLIPKATAARPAARVAQFKLRALRKIRAREREREREKKEETRTSSSSLHRIKRAHEVKISVARAGSDYGKMRLSPRARRS